MPNQIDTFDYNDTFLNINHLKSGLPQCNVKVAPSCHSSDPKPPYRITIPKIKEQQGAGDDKAMDVGDSRVVDVSVEAHVIPNRGPYIYNQPKK